METPYFIKLNPKKNSKPGTLTPLEDFELGMDIKRVFYIYGFDTQGTRGHHGHYNTTQIIICLVGSCIVSVTNNDFKKKYCLDQQSAFVLPPGNSLIMSDFTPETILLVLCDKNFRDDKVFNDSPQISK